MALILAMLSSVCFGVALVSGSAGLRTLDARSGAAISIPSATLVLLASAPFALDIEGFSLGAALVFALVGLFFPAVVTILTFRSNEQVGPTVTSAVSGTAPLFALLAAAWFLGEKVPAQSAAASVGIVVGVALLSRTRISAAPGIVGWSLLWAIAGAVVRGLAQVGAKAGLLLWANAFAASLIGYMVSSAVVIGADRLGHSEKRKPTMEGIAWFALTGVLNGGAVLLMYAALSTATVSLVAPVVAAYPLVTALVSSVTPRGEALTARTAAGSAITVAAIVYLVASGTGA